MMILVLKDLGAFAIDLVTSVAKLLVPYYWMYVVLALFFFARFYRNLQRERRERDKRFEEVRQESKRKLQESIDTIEI